MSSMVTVLRDLDLALDNPRQDVGRADLEKRFPWIVLWEQEMCSYDYYRVAQLELAARTDAPPNAIYYNTSRKKWHTTDEVKNVELRQRWGLLEKKELSFGRRAAVSALYRH